MRRVALSSAMLLASGCLVAAPAALSAQTSAPSSSSDVSPAAQEYANKLAAAQDPRRPAPSKPGAMTLQQVLDKARTSNLTLQAANANLRSVQALEVQAAVRQNPNLGLAAQDITEGVNANSPYNYQLQVSRLFERGNKRGYRIETAKATTAQTAAQLQDTIRQTLLMVKTAFTNMLFAKQAREISRAQLEDFRHEVDMAHDRYQAGDLGKLDYERLDLQLAQYESDAANDEIAFQQASDQLQTLMGIAVPSTDFDVTGDIIPPNVTQARDQLVQNALAQRPDLAAARAGVNVAQGNYRLAVAEGTADPTLEAEYDRTGTENSVGFNVNVPLRIFDRNQGNKESTRLAIGSAQLTEAATRAQVASDVVQAWVAYEQAKRLSDKYGERYLDESADVLGIARFAFDHGGLTLIDYIDALRDARTTTANALQAYQTTWVAIHQLSAASATELTP